MESNQIMQQIKSKYPAVEVDGDCLLVPTEQLICVLKELREEYGFNYLTNETAVDYKEYFQLVYNICAVPDGNTLTVKTNINREQPEVPSVFAVWPGALWQEREIFDLFGIKFTGHPDLRRILLDDDFEGYPLRKDFTWVGGRD